MALVTITGETIRDSVGGRDNRPWYAWAADYQDGSPGVVTPRRSKPLVPSNGVLKFEIEASIAAWIENPDGQRWLVTTPNEDGSLWGVIEAGIAYPPDTSQELLAAAVDRFVIANGDTIAFDAVERDGNTLLFKRQGETVGDPVDIADLVFTGDMDDIADATAVGKSVVRAATQAAARDAIDALHPDDVASQITTAIAEDGTVVDAAAAAVDADIAGRDLVEHHPIFNPDRPWSVTDGNGDAAIYVNSVGRTWFRPLWQPPTYNYTHQSLRNWFAALARAKAGTGTAHITCFVDSETYGAAATGASQPKWLDSWPGRLRRQLDALTGYTSGTGIAVPWNTITATPADDPRWTFGADAAQLAGAAVADPKYGVLGRGAIQLTNDTDDGWLEFTPAEDVTQFTIYAMADSGASGTATVKVDDVSVGTFDVSAAGGGGTLTRLEGTPTNIIVVTVDELASGEHTLRIEGPAASTVTIWGVEGATGSGVRVSNLARSSCSTDHLTINDATNNTYGPALHVETSPADLAILMLGLNDRPTASETFRARVTTSVGHFRAVDSDVLLVIPGEPDYEDGAVGTVTMQARIADMYALADILDVPLLDMAWVRGDFDTADALGLLADGIHSSDTGLEHHAHFIFNTLTGR